MIILKLYKQWIEAIKPQFLKKQEYLVERKEPDDNP